MSRFYRFMQQSAANQRQRASLIFASEQVADGPSGVPARAVLRDRELEVDMMRLTAVAILATLIAPPTAKSSENGGQVVSSALLGDVRQVAPVLEQYAADHLQDLWRRSELAPRDRSIVTLSALIARNQTVELKHHIGMALDNGVKPTEIAEIIAHLAFYSGWGDAMSAVAVARQAFKERDINIERPQGASVERLPLDEKAEAERRKRVGDSYGAVSPGTVRYTTDILFLDLWLRPDLAPRDRSMVTVSALIASGQIAQVSFHLNKAMDNGLTKVEAGEMITQLAFYAGWPKAFSAMATAKDVFEKREK